MGPSFSLTLEGLSFIFAAIVPMEIVMEFQSLKDIVTAAAKAKAEAAESKKVAGKIAELDKLTKKALEQIKKSGKEFAEAEE